MYKWYSVFYSAGMFGFRVHLRNFFSPWCIFYFRLIWTHINDLTLITEPESALETINGNSSHSSMERNTRTKNETCAMCIQSVSRASVCDLSPSVFKQSAVVTAREHLVFMRWVMAANVNSKNSINFFDDFSYCRQEKKEEKYNYSISR